VKTRGLALSLILLISCAGPEHGSVFRFTLRSVSSMNLPPLTGAGLHAAAAVMNTD
jgi:hypothetical protein